MNFHSLGSPIIHELNLDKMKNITVYFLLIYTMVIAQGCAEFLDSKPSKDLVVPSSLDDFQGLLDSELRGMNVYPLSGFVSSDDHYFGSGLMERQAFTINAYYLWQDDPHLPDAGEASWSFPYQKVFYANVVLDGLANFKPNTDVEQNRKLELEASAKFYRAMGHFEVLMHYAEPYDPAKTSQLGVPIRLSSDINITKGRSTMKEGFDQILNDIESGIEFLPSKPEIPTRPSKWASYAMLSRVYLAMHDFESAYENSQKALSIGDELMDYKTLNSDLPFSFPLFNKEVIFYQRQINTTYTSNGETFVNPDLIALYDSSDLRLNYFFKPAPNSNEYNFRGNYTGDFYHFGGIATDEVLLNFAESAAKTGRESEAIEALNHLLEFRLKENSDRVSDLGGLDLMKRILIERRKELLFRGISWLDLKRHNIYPELARTLERKFNTEKVTLPPGDPRFAFLIPPQELNLNPMPQNLR